MKQLIFILSLFLCSTVQAQEWSFSSPIIVSDASEKTFHHLESSGRRNIAISSDAIAIVWEDDRDGIPSIYLALKTKNQKQFTTEIKISGSNDAFEPSITSMSESRFAISWEENEQIFVRIVDAVNIESIRLGEKFPLPIKQAMQSNIIAENNHLYIIFTEQFDRHSRIRLAKLELKNKLKLNLLKHCKVDPKPVLDSQMYPSIILLNKNGEKSLITAWEDRRKGHTIIMGSESKVEKFCQFSPIQRISKLKEERQLPFGKGHGVARVSLTSYGDSGIFSAWADKRDFREGYDIYAADFSSSKQWMDNIKVQDDFGGVARQWHATVAGLPNNLRMVAWSDERESTSDIFYSWYEENEWAENIAISGASGKGEQTHPSIVIDKDSSIHLAWIHRDQVGGKTQLKYIVGHLIN